MESGPRKERGRSKHKHRLLGGKNPAKQSRRTAVQPTSSFSSIRPSSAPVSLEVLKQPPPVWRSYLLGLAGVTLLILLGGGHNAFALSLSLLLPGIALLLQPPTQSLGVWMDRLIIALLAVMLFSFVPQFYWPDPVWRGEAKELFGINLPLTLSVQPWVSFEAWLCALAGFAWFYAASSWKINQGGRKWFYFAVCIVVGILATVVFWGNASGAKYPSGENSPVFSFFPDRNQTANFLAVGGVAAFGYAMSVLRTRQLLPLVGLVVSSLCFLALVWGISLAGLLLFFLGILVWYFLQLASGRISKGVKLGIPLLLIAFSVFMVSNSRSTERVLEFITSHEMWSEDFRRVIAIDTLDMIKDAPLTGHGLGTFAVVFPQYRESSSNAQRFVHPESDVLWFAAEAGILGLALLAGIVTLYFFRCRGFSNGSDGMYRLAAMAPLILFMLHGFADVSGHSQGTMYFAILFAALALPRAKKNQAAFKPRVWRFCGGILVLFGLIWGLSGLTGLPLHSKVALAKHESVIQEGFSLAEYESAERQADKWVRERPMDWRAYFQRATLTLAGSGDKGEASADFRRAGFVEPVLGVVPLEAGFAWIPYDVERAVASWREAIFRELETRDAAYRRIMNEVGENPELRPGVARLSEMEPEFRIKFLSYQSGDDLMQELNRDLERDAQLGQFSREQRTTILKRWIGEGDPEAAEKYLEKNGSNLNRPWWLWSLLRKEQARFEDAVNHIRAAITPPKMPEVPIKGVPFVRLNREFTIAPGDVLKGTALLQIYLKEEDFAKVREVTQAMIAAQRKVPLYVTYWQAESYFRLQDYIESWYAYEECLKQMWDPQ